MRNHHAVAALTPPSAVLESLSKADEALAFLELNTEFYPKSARTYGAMARVYSRKHDTDRAIKSLEKVLEIEPDNPQARRMLGELRKPATH